MKAQMKQGMKKLLGESPKRMRHRLPIKQLVDLDFPSFSSVLSYRYYDNEHDLLINEGSIGFGLELSVLTGADEKLIQGLSDVLRYKLQDAMDIQFVLWGSQQVGAHIDAAFDAPDLANPMLATLTRTSAAYYKKAATSGFTNRKDLPLTLRDYRLFCFVSKKVGYSEQAVLTLQQQRLALEAEMTSMSFSFTRIQVPLFLSLLRAWVNPDPHELVPCSDRWDAHHTLNEHIVDPSFELIHEPDCLQIGVETEQGRVDNRLIHLSIKTLPDQFALWMGADNFFNVFRATQSIRCPFLISMHIRLVDQAKAKTMAQHRFLSMEKKAKSIYAKYISGTGETAAQWKKIRDDLSSDEVRLCKTFFNVVLFSDQKNQKTDEASAVACFRYNGIELFNTKYMQLQSYLATLPFMVSEGLFDDLKRARRFHTLTTWNAVNLLPLVADYKLGQRGLLLPTFRNQVACFDPFDPVLPITNFNMAVAATSGSGKSFLVQAIALQLLRSKGQCWVIDLGESYRKFCETVGGVYLDASQLCLNPFTHVKNIQEDSEKIRDLLSVLASPNETLTAVQEEVLRSAIIAAWQKQKNKTNIDDVVAELQHSQHTQPDIRIGDLITLLQRYTTTGAYPTIFNERSSLAPDVAFVVLELGQLESRPTLMKAVLFALMMHIEDHMYQSDRLRKKMVIIDEAWRLVKGDHPAAARFIEKGFRTARRHNGSFVLINQGISDYHQSVEAQAAWNCSDIKVIMRQNSKAFQDFIDEHPNYFSPYVERLIKNFGEAKANGFSEFLLQIGQVQSFHRLFVDPFSRVMFSSSGDEFEAVRRYQEQGLNLMDAIDRVARENYPIEMQGVCDER